MKELSKSKIKFFIKDEKMATKEYHSYGLHNLERDEKRHANFLKRKLKTM